MIGGTPRWIMAPDRINFPLINDIAKTLGMTITPQMRFVAGTIFWVRWSLLKRFIEGSHINLRKEYDQCELGYLINDHPTHTHSWERLFGYLVGHYGSQIVSAQTLQEITLMGQMGPNETTITHLWYGRTEQDATDVLAKTKMKTTVLRIKEINTNQLWCDPSPDPRVHQVNPAEKDQISSERGQQKHLWIQLKDGEILLFDENNAHLSLNDDQGKQEDQYRFRSISAQSIQLEFEPGDNFEQYITFRSHPSLGWYRVTYFDWLYYYEKYKPWISQRSYQECIKHYLTYGFQTHLTTFEKGCNLLQKYKIKVIASFMTPSHKKDQTPSVVSLQRQAELARQH